MTKTSGCHSAWRKSAYPMRGMGSVEYVLITTLMVGMLLTPFSLEDEEAGARSVMIRITDAVKREHSGYLYAASIPAWPRGDITVGGNTNSGSGGSGGDNSGGGGIGGVEPPGGGGEPPGGIGGPIGGGGTGGDGGIGGPPDIGGGGGGGPGNPGGGLPGGLPIAPGGPVGGPIQPPGGGEPISPPGGAPGIPPIDPDGSGPAEPIIVGGPPGSGPFPLPGSPGSPFDPELPHSPVPGSPDTGAPPQCTASAPLGEQPGFTPISSTANADPKQQYYGNQYASSQGASQPGMVAASHVGNPIHVATGNKYQQEVDLRPLPGGLSFIRHYNSRTQYQSGLGYGWRHNYEVNLQDKGNRITIWQGDSRQIDFKLTHVDDYKIRHYSAVQRNDGTLSVGDFYRWQWADGTQLTFALNGRLHSITDTAQRITRFEHNQRGQIISMTDHDGRSLRLSYSPNGWLTTMTDPGDLSIQYRYDAIGNLIKVIYPDNTARVYHYDDPRDRHNLTGISVVESDGTTRRFSSYAYDDQDRAVLSTRADDVGKVTLKYEPTQTQVTDAAGQISLYKTDTHNGVPVITAIHGPGCSPCGQRDVEYSYNQKMQVIQTADSNGRLTHYSYDQYGRLTRAHHQLPSGQNKLIAQFEYLGNSEKITAMYSPSVNPQGLRSMVVQYDEDNQPIQVTQNGYAPKPEGGFETITRSQRYEYDKYGRLIAVDGYRSDVDDVIRLEWDRRDRLIATYFPDGGSLKTLDFDQQGRQTKIQSDDNTPLIISYTARGLLSSISNESNALKYQYDASGKRTAFSIGDRQYRLKQAPVLAASKQPATSQSLRVKPAVLSVITQGDIPDYMTPEKLMRDALGQLISLSDQRGNTTRYGMDDFGRQVFINSPDTGLTLQYFDEANNLIRKIDASGYTAVMKYDAGNRLVSTHLEDSNMHFTWSGIGDQYQLTRVQSGASGENVQYDEEGRVAARTIDLAGRSYTTRYRYNDQGRMIRKTLPDGRKLKFNYAGNRLQDIREQRFLRSGISLYSRLDESEGSSGFRSLNGKTTRLERSKQKLSRLTVDGLYDLSYTYSPEGRIVGIDNYGSTAHRYRYDDRGRLDFALTPQALYGYHYDANGNRERLVINGEHVQFNYASHNNWLTDIKPLAPDWHPPMQPELHRVSWNPSESLTNQSITDSHKAVSTRHDNRGDLLEFGGFHIEYTANGQPESVYQDNRRVARYQYNSRAERIAKTVFEKTDTSSTPETHGETTYYLYENQQLTAEVDAQGVIQRQYLYIGHHPIAILMPEKRLAVHTNHLGAPVAVTDEQQALIWQASYAPFGRVLVNEDPDQDGQPFTLNLRLPGQYEDSETGLYYNYHRYYNPGTGRYISSDPMGLKAGMNTYAYVANDPVNNIDPLGLLLFAFDGTGNNEPPEGKSDFSNVVKFKEAYDVSNGVSVTHHGGNVYYISGAGTDDSRSGINANTGDSVFGRTMPQRIIKMGNYFIDYVELLEEQNQNGFAINLDVIGFSRGAASARMFVNLMADYLDGEDKHELVKDEYTVIFNERGKKAREYLLNNCISVAFRFLGLWDTVPHYLVDQNDDFDQLNLEVPGRVKHVAHAIAANEEREAFHVVSIYSSRVAANYTLAGPLDSSRTELGFLGAHADIGGAYTEGDLSDVALMWMVKKAREAQVGISRGVLVDEGWDVVTSPVLHSSVGVFALPPGRNVKYLDGTHVRQVDWQGYGMDNNTSSNYYDKRYLTNEACFSQCWSFARIDGKWKSNDNEDNRTLIGMVGQKDLQGNTYSDWLKNNYNLNISIKIDKDRLRQDGKPKGWNE